MDRLTTGIMIAAATLLMTGGLSTDVLAREPGAKPGEVTVATSPAPASTHSGRILSLLLTLDALRLAPGLLDSQKV